MSKDNYAVWDTEKEDYLSKIMISFKEAKEFYDLCLNRNKAIIIFGWSIVEPQSEGGEDEHSRKEK